MAMRLVSPSAAIRASLGSRRLDGRALAGLLFDLPSRQEGGGASFVSVASSLKTPTYVLRSTGGSRSCCAGTS
jgi:hypothetical protein